VVDEVTVAAWRRGDLGACERLYRQFNGPAFNVAARIVNCRELAQEVTQEAFLTAFRRSGQYRGDAPFWAWFKRVVVNHAISALRRLPPDEHVTFEDSRASTLTESPNPGRALDLEAALARLDDEDRAVVWLHDVEGYRHREIAELFGRTESFSKTRLSRARQRLRDWMKQEETSSAGQPGDDAQGLRTTGLNESRG
jgi:RNA polymerase sigma-70 factor (ECF subfamily)